ncbi:general transcription factor II-I repeat domain-containing protein 2B-like [Galendromus occidentalis]|uniref:General transcription factor II-I repeat domain-containing protein 2B-like n=1 Tax=Galendromus occidentalis TaxID=34638 RepID=A0AAJ7WJF3_9ACAR|nr:general transcription factor II-I repeat domain-containing protein 2B-like [Galendromus occidentalis]
MASRRTIADENRKFNKEWTVKYFFVEIDGRPCCLVCRKSLSVFKEYNLRRHQESMHPDEELLSATERLLRVQELMASLSVEQRVSSEIDRADAALKEDNYETNRRHHSECRRAACKKSKILLEWWSIAMDESTDAVDTAQLLIFIRAVDSQMEIHEELAALCPMMGTTTGRDICEEVFKVLAKHELPLNKIPGCCTDGAPAMIGRRNGAVVLLEKKMNATFLKYHCIVHQEALCARVFKCKPVLSVVTGTVNSIRSRALTHRAFRAFLQDVEAEFGDVLYHAEVRWLSRGRMLDRFFTLRSEILSFARENGSFANEIANPEFWQDIAFLTDIMSHMNELNLNLQGKNKFAPDLYFEVKCFVGKLKLFMFHPTTGNLVHFPRTSMVLTDPTEIENKRSVS